MRARVELDPQVADFVCSLAPEPRKHLREGLRGLEQDKGDIQQLEADLAGYARLRVGGYRVIVRFFVEGGQRVARCVYAEKRAVVYELFSEILRGSASRQ